MPDIEDVLADAQRDLINVMTALGAVLALVSDYWTSRGRDPPLRGETIPGLIERQFWVGSVGDPELLPRACSPRSRSSAGPRWPSPD
jgi:hypothetical protein